MIPMKRFVSHSSLSFFVSELVPVSTINNLPLLLLRVTHSENLARVRCRQPWTRKCRKTRRTVLSLHHSFGPCLISQRQLKVCESTFDQHLLLWLILDIYVYYWCAFFEPSLDFFACRGPTFASVAHYTFMHFSKWQSPFHAEIRELRWCSFRHVGKTKVEESERCQKSPAGEINI